LDIASFNEEMAEKTKKNSLANMMKLKGKKITIFAERLLMHSPNL